MRPDGDVELQDAGEANSYTSAMIKDVHFRNHIACSDAQNLLNCTMKHKWRACTVKVERLVQHVITKHLGSPHLMFKQALCRQGLHCSAMSQLWRHPEARRGLLWGWRAPCSQQKVPSHQACC